MPIVHSNSDFAKKKKYILDQRYLLNKLLDQGGNLRGNIPVWASVKESPRRLSVLIFLCSLLGPGLPPMVSIQGH